MTTLNAIDTTTSTSSRRAGAALWAVQALLAALFLFAGAMKLVMPIEALEGPVAFPGWFLRFIGAAELAGGLGLILPGLFRVQRVLTPIAAAGLTIIMIGAVATVGLTGPVSGAIIPLVVGILTAVVAYGRRNAR